MCYPIHWFAFFGREKNTQTKTDAITIVPKPSVFCYGLRGHARTGPTEPAAATVLTAVDLTLNVDAHLERSIPIPPAPTAASPSGAAQDGKEKTGTSGTSTSSTSSGEQVERSAEENAFYAMLAERLANGEDVGDAAEGGDGGDTDATGEEAGGAENDPSEKTTARDAAETEGAQTERSTDTVAAEGAD